MNFFKRFYLFIFREKGRWREKEGEKHPPVASRMPPTGDLAHNPSRCPDGKSNWRPFCELVTFWFAGQHSIH